MVARHVILLAGALVSAALVQTSQQTAGNMNLMGAWNQRASCGDIWGYTAPDRRENALLCVRPEGLSIIDIAADPPVEVGFAPSLTPSRDTKDVKVYDHYAILIMEGEPAQVIDLTDPAKPVTVSTIQIGPATPHGGAHNALVDGHFLYAIGDHGRGGHRFHRGGEACSGMATPGAAIGGLSLPAGGGLDFNKAEIGDYRVSESSYARRQSRAGAGNSLKG